MYMYIVQKDIKLIHIVYAYTNAQFFLNYNVEICKIKYYTFNTVKLL